jgi:signal transduction histidine kinase
VTASQTHTLDSFRIASAIALGLIGVLSFGLSWWMAGRVLRPVHAITDAARRLSEQTLHRRINLEGPDDELKELADTFDAMLGRLDRAFRSQQRFVANASHELRTPLATERVLIDEALANRSAQPEDFRSILEQLRTNSEETERLVDALLVLARSERGLDRWSEVDLAATAQGALDAAALEAGLKGVELRSELSPVAVKGDPGLLDRLVGNILENGIRHNFAGGWVEVTTSRSGTWAVLEVTNTGPLLDEVTVATLTEPFRRAGPDRSADDGGFGLGLSIVDGVVNAHLGSMTLHPRPGGGLEVQVQLPAATGTVLSPGKEHGPPQRS